MAAQNSTWAAGRPARNASNGAARNGPSRRGRSRPWKLQRRAISVEQVWRERAAIYPQNRVLEPREVAQVIAFLCSDAAGCVNGEAITVALGGIW